MFLVGDMLNVYDYSPPNKCFDRLRRILVGASVQSDKRLKNGQKSTKFPNWLKTLPRVKNA